MADRRAAAGRRAALALSLLWGFATSRPGALEGQRVITTAATATYQTVVGPDSAVANLVETTIVVPDLFVEKVLTGAASARVGEDVDFVIRYGNSSDSVLARAVVIVDTLPEGLEYVGATPPGQAGARIVTWAPGDLAPGDTGQINLTTRVSQSVQDTIVVTNIAGVTAANAASRSVPSPPIELVGTPTAALSLEKTADVLEIAVGETAPYSLVLRNTGPVSADDVRIHDRLPEGARYAEGSTLGADSVVANDRDLTFFVPGPLAPGDLRTVRYQVAVVSADGGVLENRAYATAEAETVRSPEAVNWLRVRTTYPMETRGAIGKVWVDLDGNGIQDPGEPGLEHADVWTDDGEVATTDQDGKFSYRNLRPGGHSFRLDRLSVPAGYAVIGSEDLTLHNADGWTTPYVLFRVMPVEGVLRAVHVQRVLTSRFTARPLPTAPAPGPDGHDRGGSLPAPVPDPQRGGSAEGATREPLVLKGTGFDFGEANLDDEARRILGEVAESLFIHQGARIEISGHADSTGPAPFNQQLAVERASAVRRYLTGLGIDPSRLVVVAHGSDRPIASNETAAGRALNRRVELSVIAYDLPAFDIAGIGSARDRRRTDTSSAGLPGPRRVEYEVMLHNTGGAPLPAIEVGFDPFVVDSAVALRNDSVIARLDADRLTLHSLAPDASAVVKAWAVSDADSATAVLHARGEAPWRLAAEIHNPLTPVDSVFVLTSVADSMPRPETLARGAHATVHIDPSVVGWPTATFPVPAGWEPVSGTARLGGAPVEDPALEYDRSGAPYLSWSLDRRNPGILSVNLAPSGSVAGVGTVTVPPLRTSEERDADAARAFLAGPGVTVFSIEDGAVLRSDRAFVGVRGESGHPVALFDGDSMVGEGTLRIDGVHDFIAVSLARGPHRLRVRVKNSWGQERWDSLAVHVTGLPASFHVPEPSLRLMADGHSVRHVRVRLVDRWGVPVVAPTNVTVSAEGADLAAPDADPSSVGLQVASDRAGWVTVPLRAGREVGRGTVTLTAGDASAEFALEIYPQIRPLMITGVGRVGLGASPDGFGSLTARGRLDDRTSLLFSIDSRRLDAGRQDFDRSFDPLEDAQYPILGDASAVQTLSSSRYAVSARIERGFDWVAFGDVSTAGFADGLELTTYRRALSGGMAQVTTGPVSWRSFGTVTDQSLQQVQIRGAGVSGPYQLGANVSPSTEQIVIETRDRENAQRVVSRQVLVRYVDYEIDYETGTLLFKQPVPATDLAENPVFLVVTYEASAGGEQRLVGGMRAAIDAMDLLGSTALDSLRVGVTGIHANEAQGAFTLTGADLRLRSYGGVMLGGEVSHSSTPDSSGAAAAVDASVEVLDGSLSLSGAWLRVGRGFGNPSNLAFRSGTEEVKLGGALTLLGSEIRARHDRLVLEAENVERTRTIAGIGHAVGSRIRVDLNTTHDRFRYGADNDGSTAGEVKVTVEPTSTLSVWAEGRRQFAYSGNLVRPDHVGVGVGWRFRPETTLEVRHRRVLLPEEASYSVANLGLRSEVGAGTQAWGAYQLAGGVGSRYNAALVGLNNRISLGSAWTVNSMFERRIGLDRAALDDPVRALPFLQPEEDYWSFGMGVELLPPNAPYRLSGRGEYRDGEEFSTRLATLAGDISFNRSLAVLSRHQYLTTEQRRGASRQISSLWGLAFRPFNTSTVNVLTKFSWVLESNPLDRGVLTRRGEEGRLIGAAEAVWTPDRRYEFGARYAMRRTDADRLYEDGTVQDLESFADFAGGRARIDLNAWLAVHGDARLLIERTSGTRRWDAAPAVGLRLVEGLELVTGYRFGTLRDPDFSVRGGPGAFVMLNARVTERLLPTAAEFWRSRMGR